MSIILSSVDMTKYLTERSADIQDIPSRVRTNGLTLGEYRSTSSSVDNLYTQRNVYFFSELSLADHVVYFTLQAFSHISQID